MQIFTTITTGKEVIKGIKIPDDLLDKTVKVTIENASQSVIKDIEEIQKLFERAKAVKSSNTENVDDIMNEINNALS